jgi:S-adenosylmethionine hydrolase
MSMNLITFLSDFGLHDGYTASVKGIILSINPHARIVDTSHSIQSYQIEQGAYILASFYHVFPAKTVHLAVVDPGVGGTRTPLIIKTSRYFFVGPDNGLFTYIMHKEAYHAYQISLQRLEQLHLVSQTSSTFHGRDIFAPAAALLSKGTPLTALADPLSCTPHILADRTGQDQQVFHARVILIDHFGNIITTCSRFQFPPDGARKIRSIKIKNTVLSSVQQTYGDVPPGSLLALWNSSGFLEIAVNQGNAAQVLGGLNGLEYVDIVLE